MPTTAPATATPTSMATATAASATTTTAPGQPHDLRRRVPEGRPRQGANGLQRANPGATLTISTDSSTALETKIEQGAPVDVFLSADTANPQKLVDKGLAAGSVTKFAGNLLTVIVPTANPAGIKTPADIAKSGVKVIAAGDTVPITKYANQLVANLAKQPGYPADFVSEYTANIVSKQDNVAAVVARSNSAKAMPGSYT